MSDALRRFAPTLAKAGADFLDALGPPIDPARVRAAFREVAALGSPPEGVAFSPVEAAGVRAEWALAPGTDPDRRLLFVHGGQWIAGDVVTYRPLAGHLALASGSAVLSVNYRLAPEHRHPAALDVVLAAHRWLGGHGPGGQSAARQLVAAGDSAGGGLVVAMGMVLRDRRERMPNALVLLSPAVDPLALRAALPASEHPRFDYAMRLYAGDTPLTDPLVSPSLGGLAGLPPILVQWSEAEPAAAGIAAFADRAEAAAVTVVRQSSPGMPHVWHLFAPALPEALAAFEAIGSFIRAR
jgi:acetyl esterase/lipase